MYRMIVLMENKVKIPTTTCKALVSFQSMAAVSWVNLLSSSILLESTKFEQLVWMSAADESASWMP